MQTKKKNSGRNAKRDHASPRVSRMQKKAADIVQVPETKVAELITSSTRKQKCVGAIPKRSGNQDLGTGYGLIHDENTNTCLGNDISSMLNEGCNKGTDHHVLGTIFSPAFHKPKAAGGVDQKLHQDRVLDHSGADMLKSHDFQENPEHISGGDDNYGAASFYSVNSSCTDDMEVDTTAAPENLNVHIGGDHSICTMVGHCDSDLGANLSSEVSAIYLAMKNSKLECVEEHAQDSISADVYAEAEDCDEFDDFDPYLFIKNLPELSSVVPTFRRTLLPKRTRSCPRTSLVLDLDETLVHSTLEPCDDADFTFPVNFNFQEHTVYVRCRPHLRDFMDRVSRLFEIIIFTASQSIYAEQLLNVLDPKRKTFRHRVFRESCVYVDGNYLKDLSILGRDLAHVIIIDNSPQAFGFQVDNGIPIESWFDDRSDQELLLLLPFLESLVEVDDVRPLIAKRFNLREKIAAASYPFSSNRISY